jgi:hypothetical protein
LIVFAKIPVFCGSTVSGEGRFSLIVPPR